MMKPLALKTQVSHTHVRLKTALMGLLAALTFACIQDSEAAYNGCYVRTSTPQDISMDLGNIVIQPDTPVGLIKRQTFNIVENKALYCGGHNFMYGELPGSEIAPNSEPYVYKTNVPGIGIRLYRQSYNGIISTYYPHVLEDYTGQHTSTKLAAGYFVVEIFRLKGPTGAGALKPGLYSTYWGNGTGPSLPILTSHVLGNGISVVNSTCQVDTGSRNIAVDMGEAPKYLFTGVGSTVNERNFDININCVGGNDSVWSKARGDVSLSFNYTPDPDTSASLGVMKNNADRDGARGIGVQLLNNRGLPVINESFLYVGKLRPDSQTRFNIPMKARFYQTRTQVNGGDVKSIATFNIVYQ